ncbi:MAG: hypothetical protein WEB04_09195 [Dehalococcoidia bacterium]
MARDAARTSKKRSKAKDGQRPRGRPPAVRNLYFDALRAAESIVLSDAVKTEGLDDEIALLRTKIHESLRLGKDGEEMDNEKEMKLVLRSMDVLARMVATRYRLSTNAKDDLAAHIVGLVRGIGDQFFPEGLGGP